jgi:putative ABC transport system permease protein
MRLYRALLHAFPASFRAEYGEEMSAVFARRRRDASNPFAVLALWVETIFDVFFNAVAAHFDILRQDLRYAWRTMGRAPGFAMTAVAVSALGIGATTAAFTMVDHVLLRPLPFKDPEKLVKLYQNHPLTRAKYWELSPANYRDWKRMSNSFESLGCYRGLSVNLIGPGNPENIQGASVTAEIFPILGVQPVLGRYFTAEDDRETAQGTLLLSYSLWQMGFGGDGGVLGRKVTLDDKTYTIIGVMPKDFYFPSSEAKLWTAMRFAPENFEDRMNTYIYGIGRLKNGVQVGQARAELTGIAGQLAREFPKELAGVGATTILLRDEVSDQARMMLMVLLAAAGCVLLIACTNLANLLLARAMVRRKELAVRAAMGAGSERLIRQMLTESLILSGLGGILGVLIASLALPLLVRLVPVNLPIAEMPSINPSVLIFAAVVTFATGIGFGVVPALRVSREKSSSGLRETSRAGGGRRERLRSALVIAEVTGCVVLLVSAGLLIRALWRVQSVDPGFRAENVLTLRTVLPMPKYERVVTRQQFYNRVLSETRSLPGVTGAAYVAFLPMVQRGGVLPIEIAGQPKDIANRENGSLRFVTPGYFSVMGIPILQGRDVAESDTVDTPWIAVVSASFVQHYFPNQDPMGRHFDFAFHDRMIAGVVGDVRVRGLERNSEPQIYIPYRQVSDGGVIWYYPKDLAVRASGDAEKLAPALRRIIQAADPAQPVSDVRMLSEIVEAETGPRVVQVRVLGAFAGIAILLAAIGIHGVLAFAVTSRTQEIGVRMALGARRGDILGMILRDGVVLAMIGIAVGVGLAYGAGLEMQSLLAGIRPGDLETFFAAVALCFLMTLAGSLMPALRAVRIDPTVAIRAE